VAVISPLIHRVSEPALEPGSPSAVPSNPNGRQGRDAAGIDALIERLQPPSFGDRAPAIVAIVATDGIESVVAASLGGVRVAGRGGQSGAGAGVRPGPRSGHSGKRTKTDPIDAPICPRR